MRHKGVAELLMAAKYTEQEQFLKLYKSI